MTQAVPVSVVVPCHEATATVARALESVATQSAYPLEVVVVDDASSSQAAKVLDALSRHNWPFLLRVARLPVNRGPGEARNLGCRLADRSARYIAFLDADDVWLPEKLERQVGWMERRPEVAWTAHRCGIVGHTEVQARQAMVEPVASSLTRRDLLIRNPVATPSVVFRSVIPQRFRPGWRWCEDLMLWIDWLDQGHAGVMLDERLALLGRAPMTPGGSTGNLRAMYDGECKVVQTLAAERRMSSFAAVAWRIFARARYLRRVVVA
jgi:glycosyltransferase involved in cell wall biosynthesis